MSAIGYSYLLQKLGLTAFPPTRPALLKPVTRFVPEDGHLAVPRQSAPGDDVLEHLLFALKHEGTNLQIRVPEQLFAFLEQAVKRATPEDARDAGTPAAAKDVPLPPKMRP